MSIDPSSSSASSSSSSSSSSRPPTSPDSAAPSPSSSSSGASSSAHHSSHPHAHVPHAESSDAHHSDPHDPHHHQLDDPVLLKRKRQSRPPPDIEKYFPLSLYYNTSVPVFSPSAVKRAAPLVDWYERYRQLHRPNHSPQVPERCFSFCTQQADRVAYCRMLCLRKRSIAKVRLDDFARIRPPLLHHDDDDNHDHHTHSLDADAARPHGEPRRPTSRSSALRDTKAGSPAPSWSAWWRRPFEALQRRVEPYSIVYVAGRQDGIYGRYMLELEGDDSEATDYDVSMRRDDAEMPTRPEATEWSYREYVDHTEHPHIRTISSLLYVPLTTIFWPLISFPENVDRVFGPTFTLLERYAASFTDGSQLAAFGAFKDAITDGGAGQVLASARQGFNMAYEERKATEMRKAAEAKRSKEEKHMDEVRKMGKDLDREEMD